MSESTKNEDLLVGILMNPDYKPSSLAGVHIQDVLNRAGVKTIVLSLEDIIEKRVKCDSIFNVYYGEIGDGGVISGILDKNNITFVGNDQYTCSIMLNKIVSKLIFKQCGYLTPAFWYKPNTQRTNKELVQEVEDLLKYPLLIKPVNGAASENITLVDNRDQLRDFITENRIVIDTGYYFFEQFISGRELSTGYVNAIDKLLPVIEIVLMDEKYQNNKVKFSIGLKKNIIPAEVNQNIYKEAQAIARNLNSVFNCRAFSRTDIIYSKHEQKLYILEINTNPGLLKESLLPLMGQSLGIDETEFFLKMIRYSIR